MTLTASRMSPEQDPKQQNTHYVSEDKEDNTKTLRTSLVNICCLIEDPI